LNIKYLYIIKFGTHLLFAKIFRQRVPFQVHIRVIEQCNQRCSYCERRPFRYSRLPTTKQLLDTIDGLARLGTKRITLTGGEPLLRDDLYDIVQCIKHHKISCSLTTNGRLVKENIPLVKSLDQLTVSIDGDKAVHDAYRGEGSYDASVQAIKIARANGIPVQLQCTLTRLTDYKLSDLIMIAEQYNCSIDFELLHPLFGQSGTVKLRAEDAGEEATRRFIDYQLRHKNPRVVHSSSVLKFVRNWSLSYTIFRIYRDQSSISGFKPIHCYGGRFFALIEANGDLLPCCIPMPGYHSINVFELGVEKAWKKIPRNNCISCRDIGFNMFNYIFALHPRVLLEFLRIYIKYY